MTAYKSGDRQTVNNKSSYLGSTDHDMLSLNSEMAVCHFYS